MSVVMAIGVDCGCYLPISQVIRCRISYDNPLGFPQCGGQKTPEPAAHEKSVPFKNGQRFRAGIEGRISVSGRGMKRRLDRGRERFE